MTNYSNRLPYMELTLKRGVCFTNTCTVSYSLNDIIVKIEWIGVNVMVTATFCSYRIKHNFHSRYQPIREPCIYSLSKPDQEFLSNFSAWLQPFHLHRHNIQSGSLASYAYIIIVVPLYTHTCSTVYCWHKRVHKILYQSTKLTAQINQREYIPHSPLFSFESSAKYMKWGCSNCTCKEEKDCFKGCSLIRGKGGSLITCIWLNQWTTTPLAANSRLSHGPRC